MPIAFSPNFIVLTSMRSGVAHLNWWIRIAELEVADGHFDRARDLLQQGLALVPMTRPEREQRDRLESRIQVIQAQLDA